MFDFRKFNAKRGRFEFLNYSQLFLGKSRLDLWVKIVGKFWYYINAIILKINEGLICKIKEPVFDLRLALNSQDDCSWPQYIGSVLSAACCVPKSL